MNKGDFGLDVYEPDFFADSIAWACAGTYSVSLYYNPDNDYDKDFFYFCHIHTGMGGRIKFIDSNGDPLYPDDELTTIDTSTPTAAPAKSSKKKKTKKSKAGKGKGDKKGRR